MPILVSDKPTFASDQGHWYKPSGEPAYTVIGANGKERATTLRDARKLGLYPSVTTITKIAAKPGLERWKAEQLLMSALTLQQMPDESEQSWVGRVWQDSVQHAVKSAERGTRIHAAIEKAYREEPFGDEFGAHVELVRMELGEKLGWWKWEAERSFAHPSGYGGKVDLYSKHILVDIKTKDGDLADVKPYDENIMQAAAYAAGLGLEDPTCAILFVSRSEPVVKLSILEPEEVQRGARMFRCLHEYWKVGNRFGPTT